MREILGRTQMREIFQPYRSILPPHELYWTYWRCNPSIVQGGIVAENIRSLALYSESTLKASQSENSENTCLLRGRSRETGVVGTGATYVRPATC